MSSFLRVWQKFDLTDIEKHLIVAGELCAECFNCRKIGLNLTARVCPGCGVNFKYIGFRRKLQMSYLNKLKEQWPEVVLIDFDDFKKALGKSDARKLLDL